MRPRSRWPLGWPRNYARAWRAARSARPHRAGQDPARNEFSKGGRTERTKEKVHERVSGGKERAGARQTGHDPGEHRMGPSTPGRVRNSALGCLIDLQCEQRHRAGRRGPDSAEGRLARQRETADTWRSHTCELASYLLAQLPGPPTSGNPVRRIFEQIQTGAPSEI